MEISTKSAQETQSLGEKFAVNLKKGLIKTRVFCLYGELGSGKTTFTQGLAKGLKIKQNILSPTFIIMRQYSLADPKLNVKQLYHIDLYRIEKIKDVGILGLEEIWNNPNNLVVIEWPEKIEEILPKKRLNLFFEYVSDQARKIKII